MTTGQLTNASAGLGERKGFLLAGSATVPTVASTTGALLVASASVPHTASSGQGILLHAAATVPSLGNSRGVIIEGSATIPSTYRVNLGPDLLAVEPLSTITLTATTTSGPTPTGYAWETSGADVSFSGSGATRTFLAPAHPDGVSFMVSVAGFGDGAATGVDIIAITVLPHLRWRTTGPPYGTPVHL